MDIWSAGRGVMSLQLFHNITAEEAFTREACLIDAIGTRILFTVYTENRELGLSRGFLVPFSLIHP